jgi:hypothetical protein
VRHRREEDIFKPDFELLLFRLLHLSEVDEEENVDIGIHEVHFPSLAVDVLVVNADLRLRDVAVKTLLVQTSVLMLQGALTFFLIKIWCCRLKELCLLRMDLPGLYKRFEEAKEGLVNFSAFSTLCYTCGVSRTPSVVLLWA